MNYVSSHGGIGGRSSGFSFRGKTVKIGDFKLESPIIEYSTSLNGLSEMNCLGLIGNRIFERFNVIIDFKNQNLYLKPNSGFKSDFNFGKTGFSFIDRTDIYE